MWEKITRDYLGQEEADALGVEKRAQVQASLQMKFHRGVLRHTVWLPHNKAALLRAYVRWEEDRYNEILRLLTEELQKGGHAPAYVWKSIHVEAQLVELGLEPKQREPSKARRRRVQITARQQGAAGSSAPHVKPSPFYYLTPYHHNQSPQVISEMTPGLEHHYFRQYEYSQRHQFDAGCGPGRKMLPGLSYNNMQAMQLNAQPQPTMTDEQDEQLIDECLDRAVFETDSKHLAIAALERLYDSQEQRRQEEGNDTRMSGGPSAEEQIPPNRRSSPSSPLPTASMTIASTSASTSDSAQWSRETCDELLKCPDGPAQYKHNHVMST